MKYCIVLSALLALACALPQKRGAIPLRDGRIVGGETVDIEDYPYQISLLYYGSHICGGSLIASNYVVTAAHCTDGSGASSYSIRAGSSIRNSGGEVVSVAELFQNPQYDSYEIDYDISVLRLSSSLTAGSAIGFVGLPVQDQEIIAGSESVISGWGTLTEGGSLPSQLQAVRVPVVSQADCRAAYGASSITDRMMCAGVQGVGGKDACQGDSGGPLVVDGQLVGIVSWGYGCARPDYPGVYSSVPALRSYVTQVAGI